MTSDIYRHQISIPDCAHFVNSEVHCWCLSFSYINEQWGLIEHIDIIIGPRDKKSMSDPTKVVWRIDTAVGKVVMV
jgi:hypothetical protein